MKLISSSANDCNGIKHETISKKIELFNEATCLHIIVAISERTPTFKTTMVCHIASDDPSRNIEQAKSRKRDASYALSSRKNHQRLT